MPLQTTTKNIKGGITNGNTNLSEMLQHVFPVI